MTRKEFSEELKKYRDTNNIMIKELCALLGMLPRDIYRIQNASNCYSMVKALSYADAVKAQIVLKSPDVEYIAQSVKDLQDILKNARAPRTVREVSEATGTPYNAISNIENGKQALTIDKFLILADYYGLEIELRPKP